jgi:PTH2 family peptidyl-tRNA hydrolase
MKGLCFSTAPVVWDHIQAAVCALDSGHTGAHTDGQGCHWSNADRKRHPQSTLVIRLNNNVTMTRGKSAAQAVHAALLLLGVHHNGPVVVLGGSKADVEAMPVRVHDSGRTEVAPGTLTAGAEWRDE